MPGESLKFFLHGGKGGEVLHRQGTGYVRRSNGEHRVAEKEPELTTDFPDFPDSTE
jgi:hypothetical protein